MSQNNVVVGSVSVPRSLAEGEWAETIKEYNNTTCMNPHEKFLMEKLCDPAFQTPELQKFLQEQIAKIRKIT